MAEQFISYAHYDTQASANFSRSAGDPNQKTFKAGRGIAPSRVGEVVLLDEERGKADLREHLPRPNGILVSVSRDGKTCRVHMNADPYYELRRAKKEHAEEVKDLTAALDELQEEYNEAVEARQKLKAENEQLKIANRNQIKWIKAFQDAVNGLDPAIRKLGEVNIAQGIEFEPAIRNW